MTNAHKQHSNQVTDCAKCSGYADNVAQLGRHNVVNRYRRRENSFLTEKIQLQNLRGSAGTSPRIPFDILSRPLFTATLANVTATYTCFPPGV